MGDPPGGDHEVSEAAETAEPARPAAEQHAFGADVDADDDGADDTDPPVEDVILSSRDSHHPLRFVPTTFDLNASAAGGTDAVRAKMRTREHLGLRAAPRTS